MALQIAIDGPVASGKSTVARLLAQRLGFAFLDTGALYRAVTFAALERGSDPSNEAAMSALVASSPPAISPASESPFGCRITIDGRSLSEELFAPAVSQAVSLVAAMPEVRHKLVAVQRAFADERDVVMAGRDIGSVVLPDAGLKFFLTASVNTRVDRRYAELREAEVAVDRDALRREIAARDERDRLRAVSPLVKTPDAVEIDTSNLSVDQVVDKLYAQVRQHLRPL